MKHRILSAVILIPLFVMLTTTPAYAIFGAILAGIQRAQMIVNQGSKSTKTRWRRSLLTGS